MKAIFHQQFGALDTLQAGELPPPRLKPGQVRVAVSAVALNPLDVEIREGKLKLIYGSRFPKIPAHDFAGTIMESSSSVPGFQAGDRVMGMRPNGSGGSMADQLVIPHKAIAHIPASLSDIEAASFPLAAQTALQGLRDDGRLQPGQRVLINGASGGVGVYAVQLAKLHGAHVTAVCSHRNMDMVKNLGADEVVDYTQTRPETLPDHFDLIFDVYGNKWFRKIRHLLTPRGRHVSTIPALPNFIAQYRSMLGRQRTRVVIVRSQTADLQELGRWIETGKLRPVVDQVFPRAEFREAYAYLETRRAKGKVVVEWGV